MSTVLIDFVKDAMRLGKNRDEITAALRAAGWPEEQLVSFWDKYHTASFPVPIPKPTLYASPRLTTLSLFYFVVLYISMYSAAAILFTFLDYHLPDGRGEMAGFYYSSSVGALGDQIRSYLAVIIASVPLVYLSNRALQRAMRTSGQFIHGTHLKLLSLTLFVAAIFMLCNTIFFIYYFISGELSLRFIIKIGILSTVSIAIYFYFKPEIVAYEKKA